jgi:hypothetical protein
MRMCRQELDALLDLHAKDSGWEFEVVVNVRKPR